MKDLKHMRVVFWMVGALASFSMIAVCVREVGEMVTTAQILFFRSVIGLLFLSCLMWLTQKKFAIATQRLKVHALRNIFHFIAQYGWVVGIGLLPLAEVFALEFTVPIWTLIIAVIALGENLTARKIMAIVLGLLGVMVILQPGVAIIDGASLIVLGSAVCYAVAHSTTKALSGSESVLTILFYMCVFQLPMGFIFMLFDWGIPSGIEWLWLVGIGLSALSAHYCMTKAMQCAEATAVVTLDFFRLPLIALIGGIFYAEKLEIALIVGGLLMLLGNMVNLKKNSFKAH